MGRYFEKDIAKAMGTKVHREGQDSHWKYKRGWIFLI
jgi:hypothetical protein